MGIKLDPGKVKAILDMQPPKATRHIRSFIGTLSYYRRFICYFSQKSRVFIAITRKNARFKWTTSCHELSCNWNKIYKSLLKCFQTVVLYYDASSTTIGAMLRQDSENTAENKGNLRPISVCHIDKENLGNNGIRRKRSVMQSSLLYKKYIIIFYTPDWLYIRTVQVS